MRFYTRYGASAIALLAAISLAHAQQAGERQGAGAAEHPSSERGGTNKAQEGMKGGQGAASEMGREGAQQRRGANTGGENRKSQTAEEQNQGEGKSVGGQRGVQNRNGSGEGRTAEEQKNGRSGVGEADQGKQRTTERQAGEQTERAKRSAQGYDRGTERQQRVENRAEKSGEQGGRNFHVSRAQETKLHQAVVRESGIRVYHRGEVNFPVEVGTRVPDTVVFYDPPAQFVQIDPEFRRYKIIVLDGEILVVDPNTREIVDIIPA